jgi:16S rRNA (adenine1518-N6/adenine1519-N6)-dimethyltransferase
MRSVGRNLFYPVPDVDSAVLRIDVVPNKYPVDDRTRFLKLISAAFAMRRKTLSNNWNASFGIPKEKIGEALKECGFPVDVRGEILSIEDYLRLYARLF